MKVLITGNLGYIGSVLTSEMKDNYEIVGFDIGYFKDCILKETKSAFKQIIKDINDIDKADLENIDAIVHLAALSNDPLGEFDKKNTYQTNYKSTLQLAKLAKNKIKEFVYVSSQSMYGIADLSKELDEDNSDKNPVTEYARTKWGSRKRFKKTKFK